MRKIVVSHTQNMIFLSASDSSLTFGVIFGILFLLVVGIITIKAIIELVKDKKENRIDNAGDVIAGLLFCGVGCYIILLEFNLLNNYEYVEGITVQYCESGEGNKAIEFEYKFQGKIYTNCNTYNPIKNIVVPGGKFKVRVSEFEPSIGRMDFDKPLTPKSRRDN